MTYHENIRLDGTDAFAGNEVLGGSPFATTIVGGTALRSAALDSSMLGGTTPSAAPHLHHPPRHHLGGITLPGITFQGTELGYELSYELGYELGNSWATSWQRASCELW